LGRLLENIGGPEDLRGLSYAELAQLAMELRSEMVNTITKTGGHLASSLGAAELTIALHRVFDSPRDKIVWDVGHQCYAHKLLTGRRDRFSSLRQQGGLSGFPDPSESPHDAFGAGHASTSISAALGMAVARDLAEEDYHVVAVIGDGSLTGGMAFEGLNQGGHLGTRMTVVLNDNAMAISPSVGAISRALSEMRLDPRYVRTKEETIRRVRRMPKGDAIWWLIHKLKSGFKDVVLPMQIWEILGFKYIGPIDGHNIPQLEKALVKARDYSRNPVFIHVVTTKGKGYEPAEGDSVKFHGVSGKVSPGVKKASYSEVFGETVCDLLRSDRRIVAISAAMMDGTGLAPVASEFPGRVFDVGICEQHAVTFAAGLATRGFVPIVAIYSTFLQRAYDQVIHDVCIQNLPVVFAIDRAGIVGDDGKTHQGTFDLSYLGCIPNLIVAAPRDENELRQLLYTATRAGRPMAVRYPRGTGPGAVVSSEFRELPIGKGELLRDGTDVAIVAIGSAVGAALEASEALAERGISCAVVDARYSKPLDSELILDVARRTKRVITVEENALTGGFGAEVIGLLDGLPGVSFARIGVPDRFVEHGTQSALRAGFGLDAKGIAARVELLLAEFSATPPAAGLKG
jgi:1-deoxy-D-xylulose-5-phosphate synthase